MIHFDRIPEPADFDENVRQPGNKWLVEHQDIPPKDLWSPFKPQLAHGFRDLCGYSVMYEPVGTVDHYISCETDRSLAYEWGNYRFVAQWINSSKQNEDSRVLDPFEVEDGWFEVLLPSLQLVLTDAVPAKKRKRAEFTVKRLHLQEDERIIRQRQEWYRMYQENELTLDGLEKKAPLIARAIRKQQ